MDDLFIMCNVVNEFFGEKCNVMFYGFELDIVLINDKDIWLMVVIEVYNQYDVIVVGIYYIIWDVVENYVQFVELLQEVYNWF